MKKILAKAARLNPVLTWLVCTMTGIVFMQELITITGAGITIFGDNIHIIFLFWLAFLVTHFIIVARIPEEE